MTGGRSLTRPSTQTPVPTSTAFESSGVSAATGAPRRSERVASRAFFIALIGLGLLRVALTAPFPYVARNYVYDDLRYVRSGEALARGDWLGPYDHTTLSKAPGHALLLAASRLSGIPYRLAETGWYVLGVVVFALGLRRLGTGRVGALAAAAAAAFAPAFLSDATFFVLRETCVAGQSLGLAGLAFAMLAPGPLKPRMGAACAFGLLLAWFAFTREDGVWIAAPLASAAVALVASERRRRGSFAAAFGVLLALSAPAAVAVPAAGAGIRALNRAWYGAPVAVEAEDPDVRAAEGALARVAAGAWKRYEGVPASARETLYRSCPTLAAARGVFETHYRFPASVDAEGETVLHYQAFMLRDAGNAAGAYRSWDAMTAWRRRFAEEIDAACDRGEVAAGAPRRGVWPLLKPELLPEAATAAAEYFADFWRMRFRPATLGPNTTAAADPDVRALFAAATGGAEPSVDALMNARCDALALVFVATRKAAPWLALLAAAAIVARLALLRRVPADLRLLPIAFTLAAAAATSAMLGMVRAYWFPIAFDYQYRAHPLFAAGCAAAVFEAWRAGSIAAFGDAPSRRARRLRRTARFVAAALVVGAAAATLVDARGDLVCWAVKGVPTDALAPLENPERFRPVARLEGAAAWDAPAGRGLPVAFAGADGRLILRFQAPAADAVDVEVDLDVREAPSDGALAMIGRRSHHEGVPIAARLAAPLGGLGERTLRFPLKTAGLAQLELAADGGSTPTRVVIRGLRVLDAAD